jgi:hypothetical protein
MSKTVSNKIAFCQNSFSTQRDLQKINKINKKLQKYLKKLNKLYKKAEKKQQFALPDDEDDVSEDEVSEDEVRVLQEDKGEFVPDEDDDEDDDEDEDDDVDDVDDDCICLENVVGGKRKRKTPVRYQDDEYVSLMLADITDDEFEAAVIDDNLTNIDEQRDEEFVDEYETE